KTLFAFVPTSRIIPTTITRITASITAYSAMSCAESSDQSKGESIEATPKWRFHTRDIIAETAETGYQFGFSANGLKLRCVYDDNGDVICRKHFHLSLLHSEKPPTVCARTSSFRDPAVT